MEGVALGLLRHLNLILRPVILPKLPTLRNKFAVRPLLYYLSFLKDHHLIGVLDR